MKISKQEKLMEFFRLPVLKVDTNHAAWINVHVGVIFPGNPYYLSAKCRDGRHSECRSESCECGCHYC